MRKEQNVSDLIANFAQAARDHHEATLEGDSRRANKSVDLINRLHSELCRVGEQGRRALLVLAENGSDAEALMAATYSMRYNPDSCLVVLKRLSKDKGMLGMAARYAVKGWIEGDWHVG